MLILSDTAESERASWNEEKSNYLLDRLIDANLAGKAADGGFKKEAWQGAMSMFNNRFNTKYSIAQLRTQWRTLKSKYQTVKMLKEQSGFGWDPVNQRVTAESSVWDSYISSHPNAREFRNQSFPFYDKVESVSAGKVATGKNAIALSRASRSNLLSL
jgi:hypothetical protein